MAYRLAGITSLGVLTVGCNSESQSSDQRPNILYIMADDHTSQTWGAIYGGLLQPYVQTRNMERLAREGAVLENCFCTNSLSTPSRGTILTGQYSHVNGITTLSGHLSPDSNNIAKVLKQSGYQTSLIGKWHLNRKPAGFDYYNILPGQGEYQNPIFLSAENWDTGGEVYEGYCTDIITDMTIDWISNTDKSKPFFALCHFKATHEPYDYPARLKNLYADVEFPLPCNFNDSIPSASGRPFLGQLIDEMTGRYIYATNNPDKRKDYLNYPDLPFEYEGLNRDELRYKTYQKMLHDYLRCAAATDENIGRMLDYLDRSGLSENTVVIYTSDQGYFLGEHGFYDKRLIYEESLRMPFIIRYPKEIKPGTRVKDLIENVDFSALFADYAEIPYPEKMQGQSFRKSLQGKSNPKPRKYTYYRYYDHAAHIPAHFGIRGERYKLAFIYGNGIEEDKELSHGDKPSQRIFWEFFDLQEDPHENRNLYFDPRYQDIIREMKTQLTIKRKEVGDLDIDNAQVQDIIARHWND